MVRAVFHTNLLKSCLNALSPFAHTHVTIGQRQLGVFEYRKVADEIEALENESDLNVPNACSCSVIQLRDRFVIKYVTSRCGRVEQTQDRKKSGFAAA